ncbi:nucleoside hydrolase [Curtobacterium sp. MCBD17_028]|uniref:nucleoside hydrolase n=1 Tax=Curtobacterium sp. MCBD17_028 TaxID=2175670 RepID=UPI000DA9FCA6|nr:nucleoside hydrolase [Curtobacterium sp. MCBD17_028]PZE27142.1 nucleoside hydrolase [Curtobacterium sp. MCBD17_028]
MTRLILDTDLAMGAPGSDIDDGFALALAVAEPEIDLELVTTVNGNTDVESATLLTLELRRRLGIDVPVVKGAPTPLVHPERRREPSPEVVSTYGVGLEPDPGHAAHRIIEHVMANPGEITICAIGPLTNIALALTMEPRLASSVKEIVMMGGVFLGTMAHRSMPGEFNVWVDPEAAATVLRSGAPQRWVGLDVTLQVRLTRDDARRLTDSGRDFAVLAGESTNAWIDHIAERDPGDPRNRDSCAMHDPLAVAALTHPEFLTWVDAAVDVVTGDGLARGVLVTDLGHGPDAPAPNCRIATEVDVAAFTDHFLGRIADL